MEREEAIERIKTRFDKWALDNEDMKAIQTLIPELAESEDERIRKEMLDYFKDKKERLHYLCFECGDVRNAPFSEAKKIDDFLVYLEKQKEQKPEHLELKAGKWYVCHRAFCCRADHLTVKEGERFQCEKDGIVKGFVIKEPEKYFKECSAPAPMEDEQKEQKPDDVKMEWWNKGYLEGRKNAHIPARELGLPSSLDFQQKPNIELIQRSWYMEGYHDREFGQEPKWIIKTGEGGPKFEKNEKYGQPLEQKPTNSEKPKEWSEEDEHRKKDTIYFLESAKRHYADTSEIEKTIAWLKSLRPQQKQEWSEEDEENLGKLHRLLVIYQGEKKFIPTSEYDKLDNWLKSLRPQPKAELTLLDKNIIEAAVAFVEQNDHFNCWGGIDKHTVIKALHSLKPHWKPSEEQMDALNQSLSEYGIDGDVYRNLCSLYDDLSRL